MELSSLLEDAVVVVEKKEGKHLLFQIKETTYGIPILTVNEIIEIMTITPLPNAPSFTKGIINLRGKIIPVIDLRLKLGMEEKEHDEQNCIIIVNVKFKNEPKQIGVIVDNVSEVADVPASEIEAPPKYGTHNEEDYLNGVGKIKGKVVMLLNIEKVIYSEEIIELLDEKQK